MLSLVAPNFNQDNNKIMPPSPAAFPLQCMYTSKIIFFLFYFHSKNKNKIWKKKKHFLPFILLVCIESINGKEIAKYKSHNHQFILLRRKYNNKIVASIEIHFYFVLSINCKCTKRNKKKKKYFCIALCSICSRSYILKLFSCSRCVHFYRWLPLI